MDAKKFSIIAKGKNLTLDIIDLYFDSISEKWCITLKNGKKYNYNKSNVIILEKPIKISLKGYNIFYNRKLLKNITQIFEFKGNNLRYWHIGFDNEEIKIIDYNELSFYKSAFENHIANEVFEYLKRVADILTAESKDNGSNLSGEYKKIDYLNNDTVGAMYLNPQEYSFKMSTDDNAPIFPFGCNESQYQAVKNALDSRISVIEGPPGTGKTQTILNIIANLVLQNKTVQIVSNNNTAIDNIKNKLTSSQIDIDYIIARLGNSKKKDEFINLQNNKHQHFS